jgi:hypothetical protein
MSRRMRGSSTSARKRCARRALRLDTNILVAAYLGARARVGVRVGERVVRSAERASEKRARRMCQCGAACKGGGGGVCEAPAGALLQHRAEAPTAASAAPRRALTWRVGSSPLAL